MDYYLTFESGEKINPMQSLSQQNIKYRTVMILKKRSDKEKKEAVKHVQNEMKTHQKNVKQRILQAQKEEKTRQRLQQQYEKQLKKHSQIPKIVEDTIAFLENESKIR